MNMDRDNSLRYYFFHVLPRAIIRDIIFREMLTLKDMARLEVAAAVHSLHESQVRAFLPSLTHIEVIVS
jgi:hypothetical protein